MFIKIQLNIQIGHTFTGAYNIKRFRRYGYFPVIVYFPRFTPIESYTQKKKKNFARHYLSTGSGSSNLHSFFLFTLFPKSSYTPRTVPHTLHCAPASFHPTNIHLPTRCSAIAGLTLNFFLMYSFTYPTCYTRVSSCLRTTSAPTFVL